jgi:hypothetical protein
MLRPALHAEAMRRIALLLFPAMLAGCGDAGPAALPIGEINAYFFPTGGVADTIEIDTLDRLPLRGAELVAPDGRAVPATSIAARPAPSSGTAIALPTGSYAGGASALGGIAGNPSSPGTVGAAVGTRTTLLATVSNAAIALPDPVAYRRDWRRYRIRLNFGDPPDVEDREIAAPAPPAPPRVNG